LKRKLRGKEKPTVSLDFWFEGGVGLPNAGLKRENMNHEILPLDSLSRERV